MGGWSRQMTVTPPPRHLYISRLGGFHPSGTPPVFRMVLHLQARLGGWIKFFENPTYTTITEYLSLSIYR